MNPRMMAMPDQHGLKLPRHSMDPRARDGVEASHQIPSEGRLTNMAYQEYRKASQVNNVDSDQAPGEQYQRDPEGKQDPRRTSTDKQSAPVISETADQKAETGPASRPKKHEGYKSEEADQGDPTGSNKASGLLSKKSSGSKQKRSLVATLPKGGKTNSSASPDGIKQGSGSKKDQKGGAEPKPSSPAVGQQRAIKARKGLDAGG